MNKKRLATAVCGTIFGASLWGTTVFADESHKVESGDTIWGLSKQYDGSISQIKSWNGLNSNIIYVGQNLVVSKDGSSKSSSHSSSNKSTYTIQSGDTLSKIAHQYGVSVRDLMNWNNLSSSLIITGDHLSINGASASNHESKSSTKKVSHSSSSSNSSTYVVRSGDSLWKISKNYGVSVSSLKSWNNLSSDIIQVGQRLSVKGEATHSSGNSNSGSSSSNHVSSSNSGSTNSGVSNSGIVQEAKKHLGTPYVWAGTSPSGFDCSGYIQYVFKQEGVSLPRTVAGMYADNRLSSVSRSALQVGDLVFFETYKPGASHVGIYVGGNQFIHAGSSRGVEISSLSNSYWSPRYIGAKSL